ncbi:gamma-glutamyltransferase [Allonocardiopsis opalescens]|uniref:Glutathione hydrolase proenzyme n=1 Tax=Allonocardiopsis opalescens TaxID=1144618 RepID=A0A2T0Q0R4_9ACTN|nr:gamma-glutamyltransferase [Allonocardiopsis opalescens]PRX97378.1 gamma-glutamyltranspeptidase/glutathione hydrolase [Allonocardiopsis opalescens]
MRASRRLAALAVGTLLLSAVGTAPGAAADPAPAPPDRAPVATGYGGAVATVDPDATRAGIELLRRGGNAVDAAVAAAAALGVTEPYSGGIGGGGFFVYYDARSGEVHTIDGRETAPAAMEEDAFLEDGTPIPFAEAVTSGLSVGAPGTPDTWERAVERWGRSDLDEVMRPAIRLAEEGFTVDATFQQQTAANAERFADFPATRELFMPEGAPPEPGTVLRNPDLADTYRAFARHGAEAVYSGPIAEDIAATVQEPPLDPASDRNARPGLLTTEDLAGYEAVDREPVHSEYRGLDVYGMAPPSSGGIAVAETLNILETFELGELSDADALHRYLEATKLAFADRNAYVGDPAYVDVPVQGLLSDEFAAERACLIDPAAPLPAPVPAGDPAGAGGGCPEPAGAIAPEGAEGTSTTHLVTSDVWGNVVSYTFTIEQTGGSGITVPGRGFLLNNELTDFNFAPAVAGDPNLPAPGKRPRSSMAPTIVVDDGRPWLALGSPGGATIITTVAQTLVNRVDLGHSLPEAVAAPRASQRNGARTDAEPAFVASPAGQRLAGLGHSFNPTAEIGAAAALEFLSRHRVRAVAEPERRGGGHAAVRVPSPRS